MGEGRRLWNKRNETDRFICHKRRLSWEAGAVYSVYGAGGGGGTSLTVINPWLLASAHSAISCRSSERNMHRFSKELGCMDPLFLL